ncbi:fluoride efflux transporter CrcB [Streptomyces tremellae]
MTDIRQRRELRRSHYGVLGVVAVGGAIGAVARYEAGLIWPTPEGAFPWTTFLVNVVGCLVIGAFLVAVTEIFTAHPLLRPFFGTGVLGGFTTFSTYCVDVERLVDGGHAATALAYLVATLAAALAAVLAGAWTTRRLLADRSAS